MSAKTRNEQARRFNEEKLNHVSTHTEDDFKSLSDYNQLSIILKDLIDTSSKGFSGIVATAITGKHLNSNYDPLNDFYACSPRSIFEQGIFYAFENRIPCGKSAPLNVAKNISVLDEAWADGKRPQSAALAVVNFLRILEKSPSAQKDLIIDFFYFRLNEYAKNVSSISIEITEQDAWQGQNFAHSISRFVLEYPESGTIPQFVVSILMNKLYESSNYNVMGGTESVFGTNTTSKKPADIWLEKENTPFNLYEVTVKKIDAKRLDDCIQSINAVGEINTPLTFICRIPDDIQTLQNVHNGSLNYKGKIFNFIDISSFILSICSLLSSEDILSVMNELKTFVQDIKRPTKTKEGWKTIFN